MRIGLNLLRPSGNGNGNGNGNINQYYQVNGTGINTTLNQGQFRGMQVAGFNGMGMIGRVMNSKPGCSSCGK
jgi:hypothetical protein